MKPTRLVPAFPLPCGCVSQADPSHLRPPPVPAAPGGRWGEPRPAEPWRQRWGPSQRVWAPMRPYLQMFGSMNILIFYLKLIWSSGSLRGF